MFWKGMTHPRLEKQTMKFKLSPLASALALLFVLPGVANANETNNATGDATTDTSPDDLTINSTPIFNPGARGAGMGEAQAALSEGSSGVFHNPAGIALAYMYAVNGGVLINETGNTLSLAIVDSKTNPSVSAGLGVGYYFNRDEGVLDIKLPIALPVVPDRVSIGIAGRYMRAKAGDIEIVNGFSLDGGAIFRLVDGLHLGVQLKNLLDVCKQDNICSSWAPMTLGGGLAFKTRDLAAAVDIDADLGSTDSAALNVEAGFEYLIQGMVPVRVGYRRLSATSSNILTLGSGWQSKAAGVNLSYQHDFSTNNFGNIALDVSAYF